MTDYAESVDVEDRFNAEAIGSIARQMANRTAEKNDQINNLIDRLVAVSDTIRDLKADLATAEADASGARKAQKRTVRERDAARNRVWDLEQAIASVTRQYHEELKRVTPSLPYSSFLQAETAFDILSECHRITITPKYCTYAIPVRDLRYLTDTQAAAIADEFAEKVADDVRAQVRGAIEEIRKPQRRYFYSDYALPKLRDNPIYTTCTA